MPRKRLVIADRFAKLEQPAIDRVAKLKVDLAEAETEYAAIHAAVQAAEGIKHPKK